MKMHTHIFALKLDVRLLRNAMLTSLRSGSFGLLLAMLLWNGAQLRASSHILIDGFGHQSLGNATLSVSSNGLQVSNIGSSGLDGVLIGLDERTRSAHLQLSPVDLAQSGVALTFAASGMVGDVLEKSLGTLTLQNTGSAVDVSFAGGPDPIATTLRIEVYNQGAQVGAANVVASGTVCTLSGPVALTDLICGDLVGGWQCTFNAPVSCSNPSAVGDKVRLVFLNPAGRIQNLATLEVTAQSLNPLLIEDEIAPPLHPFLRIARSGSGVEVSADTRSVTYKFAHTVNGPWTRAGEGTNKFSIPSELPSLYFSGELAFLDPCTFSSLPTNWGYVCNRNVLLLIADDLGVDETPCYIDYYDATPDTSDDIAVTDTPANPAIQMPTVDRLTESGVMFLNAWSSPTCSPTRAGLYTGTCSFRHGVYHPTAPDLPAGTTTIANVLHNSGYTSALFGKWHLGETNRPLDFGWDHFSGSLGGEIESYTNWSKVVDDGTPATETGYATTNNVEDALDWIAGQTNGPWMATLAFNAPHWAGSASSKTWEMPPAGTAYSFRPNPNKTNQFRSMVECMDRSISNLLTRIDPDMLEQTTIIFMGDNGTDPQITEHFPNNHAKSTLYEGGVNVPLIIADGYTYLHGTNSPASKGKGRVVSPNRVETALVQTMDLFATIAEIGRAEDSSAGLDSISMVPYLSSASASPQRDVIFGEMGGSSSGAWDVAVRNEDYKLMVSDFQSTSETFMLYDLTTDRWGETNDFLSPGGSAYYEAIRDSLRSCIDSVPSHVGCP